MTDQAALVEGNLISADSHTVEPPWCYKDYIEPKFRNDAPYIIHDETKGDCYIIKGMKGKVSMPQTASAGFDLASRPKGRLWEGVHFEELNRGGFDPKARLADQDRDGVVAEILYPTVGMVLAGLSDHEYQHACMWAYNRWLQEFCSAAPDRLIGLGQTAVRSVDEAIKELHQFKEMGFKGVVLPGDPGTEEDYDHPSFDPLWRTAVELELPISFHILTGGQRNQKDSLEFATQRGMGLRGPFIGVYMTFIRGLQDIIAMFIFGGVFERHPDLKLVAVEADAGWAPHWMCRSDHAYRRLRNAAGFAEMKRTPGETFYNNIYLTFGDDWSTVRSIDQLNSRRLLWANDYPHTDALWPDSQEAIGNNMMGLSKEQRSLLLRDNVAELYGLNSSRSFA